MSGFAILRGRRGQSRSQVALEVPLLTVAHGDLDAEIDADADKQDGESHRDEIERADHGETNRSRDRQSDEQAEHHREHEPARAEREPQDEQHRGHCQDDVEQGAISDRPELIVGHGDGPGEAHAHAVVLGETKLTRPSCGSYRRRPRPAEEH